MKENDQINTIDVAKEAQQKIYESFGINIDLLWGIKKENQKDIEDTLVDTLKQQNDLLKKLHNYIKKHEQTTSTSSVLEKATPSS